MTMSISGEPARIDLSNVCISDSGEMHAASEAVRYSEGYMAEFARSRSLEMRIEHLIQEAKSGQREQS